MDNATRRQLLQRHRQSGFPGSILDVYRAYDQGIDLIGQFEQQNNIGIANTPEQQQQGLRPAHQAGDVNQSMVFPDVPPNTPFNTMGMKAPINIQKFDEQGHLVKSYENVPPGVQSLPTGPQRGTIIETPANMQGGGLYNYDRAMELGYEPDKFGHLPSVDDQNGMWLKSAKHPTAVKELIHGYLGGDHYKTHELTTNPSGYFGKDQLQYVPRKMQSAGPYYPVAESTARPSFAEQAFLNQQNALPTLDTPRYRDQGTIKEGNFEVDENNNIVEKNPSFLEMAANPMATARAIINPAVEGLPSEAEFAESKSKGTGIGQLTNDIFNPAAWVNYGVNAYQDFGDATSYLLQGEGQKALQSAVSGSMNALGAVPAFGAARAGLQVAKRAGVTGVSDLYKANPYLKNPMGFRNVGDKPNFLFGYNKPIDPKRIDLSPEAGFDELLGKQSYIEEYANQRALGSKGWSPEIVRQRSNSLAELYNKTPFGQSIGEGSFGTVHPIKGTDSVIKIGKADLGPGLPTSRYSGMTEDFLDRASDLSHLDNVAIPYRSGVVPPKNYGPPQKYWPDSTFQPKIPKTELTVMKGLDTSSDFGFTGFHAGRNPNSIPGLVQPSRDQFAGALRKIRQMRDKGIGIDLDNPANIRFNRNTGDFNLYDLENMPQLSARNARELEQLNIRYGKMIPYPNSPAHAGQVFKDPSHYMQEARTMLGTVGGGIPNKAGLRLIDNFQKGGYLNKIATGINRRATARGAEPVGYRRVLPYANPRFMNSGPVYLPMYRGEKFVRGLMGEQPVRPPQPEYDVPKIKRATSMTFGAAPSKTIGKRVKGCAPGTGGFWCQ